MYIIIILYMQVLRLRTVHEHLLRLLSSNEQLELNLANAFSPFSGLHPLQPNPYTEPLWKVAVAQYERAMELAEGKIATKLRSKIRGLEAQPHQLLREFQRYRDLIKRPSISRDMVAER